MIRLKMTEKENKKCKENKRKFKLNSKVFKS